MKNILDNSSLEKSVGNFLKQEIPKADLMRAVSAYFTIYAYESLETELSDLTEFRFLYGDPRFVGLVDPDKGYISPMKLTGDGLTVVMQLQQKLQARKCLKWLEDANVKIRSMRQSNFLHGKMYHLEKTDTEYQNATVGSANFTLNGLGLSTNKNIEINILADEPTAQSLKEWFDILWSDERRVLDVKEKVREALQKLGKDYSPEFVFYKTLFEYFKKQFEEYEQSGDIIEKTHLPDTEIWQKLYQFQKSGAHNIIAKLNRFNGCILADSVGLGKTWTALAVIKYFELLNERVLVLCPKRLEENWKYFTQESGIVGNPLEQDRFAYKVLAHTDLSYPDKPGLRNFNWGAYNLVVIDESHNFRNDAGIKKAEDGTERMSRYRFLLEKIIKEGARSKVLMLSATPVNNSMRDLRNQIYLMTEGSKKAYQDIFEIKDLERFFARTEVAFKKWEKERSKDKAELMRALDDRFFNLLGSVSIARSRRHIKEFYKDAVQELGSFPKHAPLVSKKPEPDDAKDYKYQDTWQGISNFGLSIYKVFHYVKDLSLLEREKAKQFNQKEREEALISMLRINFLKRLESSPHAFSLTLERTINKIEERLSGIKEWNTNLQKDAELPEDMLDEGGAESEEDTELVFYKRDSIKYSQLDTKKWETDLQKDKAQLQKVLDRVKEINPDRDGKLKDLKEVIRKKWQNAPTDNEGNPNYKILIFSTFLDTTKYLYENLRQLAEEHGRHIAMVSGGGQNMTSTGNNGFHDILNQFAPHGRGVPLEKDEDAIDLLIATDCLSEGQNLQDCDCVVNYDIHWNPVRLIQRFGRIDRLGSKNKEIRMINYWPPLELDDYLNLEGRVEARKGLMELVSTGDSSIPSDMQKVSADGAQLELSFRNEQTKKMEEAEDIEDLYASDNSLSLSDLSMDDLFMTLQEYLATKRKELEEAPLGIYAVTDLERSPLVSIAEQEIRMGVIFCLGQKEEEGQKDENSQKDDEGQGHWKSVYLVYLREDRNATFKGGDVADTHISILNIKKNFRYFQALASGKKEPLQELCSQTERELSNKEGLDFYTRLARKAISDIIGNYRNRAVAKIGQRDFTLPNQNERPQQNNLELISWLIIKDPSQESPFKDSEQITNHNAK